MTPEAIAARMRLTQKTDAEILQTFWLCPHQAMLCLVRIALVSIQAGSATVEELLMAVDLALAEEPSMDSEVWQHNASSFVKIMREISTSKGHLNG